MEHDELSESQRRGTIKLLQKRGRDPTLMQNWRPGSVTNVDYEILTKAFAIRTENILSNIINEDHGAIYRGKC